MVERRSPKPQVVGSKPTAPGARVYAILGYDLQNAKKVGMAEGRLRSLSAAEGKGGMDAAGRLEGRPGVRQQDVAERRAKPTAPESEYTPF